MRRPLFTAVAVLASLTIPTAAKAAILNGGFEDGLTGWEAIGDYKVETSVFGTEPVEGSSQAFLSTAFNEVVGLDESGTETLGGKVVPTTFISNFAEAESLEGFLGTSTFLGDQSFDRLATATPIEGSALKQTFTAAAGDTVSFSWNFLTNESSDRAAVDDYTYPDFNDFAFASIQSDSGSQWFRLADTVAGLNPSSTSFDSETGFRTFSYTIPTAGNYTLGIGVVDVGEATRISGLLVDNVEAVPEPNSTVGTLGLLFLGASWMVTASRKSKVKSQ